MERQEIFISYASEDLDRARWLHEKLCENGFDPWFDKEKLLPGEDWNLEIRKAIRNSRLFLICLTPQAVSKKGFIQNELKQAIENAKEFPKGEIYLIPVILEKCDMPEEIRNIQCADLSGNAGFERLIEAIHRVIRKQEQNVNYSSGRPDLKFRYSTTYNDSNKLSGTEREHLGSPFGIPPTPSMNLHLSDFTRRGHRLVTPHTKSWDPYKLSATNILDVFPDAEQKTEHRSSPLAESIGQRIILPHPAIYSNTPSFSASDFSFTFSLLFKKLGVTYLIIASFTILGIYTSRFIMDSTQVKFENLTAAFAAWSEGTQSFTWLPTAMMFMWKWASRLCALVGMAITVWLTWRSRKEDYLYDISDCLKSTLFSSIATLFCFSIWFCFFWKIADELFYNYIVYLFFSLTATTLTIRIIKDELST